MAETRFPSAPNEFCITDVGSTTTKALLFLNQAGAWRCFRHETPTTVEKPHEDVTVGVLLALRGLERGQERGGDDGDFVAADGAEVEHVLAALDPAEHRRPAALSRYCLISRATSRSSTSGSTGFSRNPSTGR